jgi:hypothetical protein
MTRRYASWTASASDSFSSVRTAVGRCASTRLSGAAERRLWTIRRDTEPLASVAR